MFGKMARSSSTPQAEAAAGTWGAGAWVWSADALDMLDRTLRREW